jgi:hypothetical protein
MFVIIILRQNQIQVYNAYIGFNFLKIVYKNMAVPIITAMFLPS